MLYQILSLVLDAAAGLVGGACLLRLYMQRLRVPFGNPVGRFVFALSDWLVVPLRRLLPAVRRWDTASLVGAYLIVLLQITLLWLASGTVGPGGLLPLAALFGLLRLVLTVATVLVIVGAIMSWVRADSSLVNVIEHLCAPLLRPLRRVIPLVGGIDLSPLALLLLLQVAGIVLGGVQASVI